MAILCSEQGDAGLGGFTQLQRQKRINAALLFGRRWQQPKLLRASIEGTINNNDTRCSRLAGDSSRERRTRSLLQAGGRRSAVCFLGLQEGASEALGTSSVLWSLHGRAELNWQHGTAHCCNQQAGTTC